ncbi:trimeric intracellular cation channel family protein [Ottowia sp.]|uniref:trimeric intracellular cation channel family protein n=1 Tax=Ottowia sp. TaxID=1898956 RepID=UPI003A88229A
MNTLPTLPPIWAEWLHTVLEATATLAFALSGVLAAARKNLDLVGVCVVAFVTAFGGGTLRDILIDQRPFFWVQHVEFVWVLMAVCLVAVLFMHQRHVHPTERALLWPDAMGLGMFTAVGVNPALAQGLPPLVAVMMGVTTSCLGGVLRDVLCNELPRALSDRSPYAACAFIGGWLYVGVISMGLPPWIALVLTVIFTAALRLVAVWRGWQLPAWNQ